MENDFNIGASFNGLFTATDILKSEGSIFIKTNKENLSINRLIFSLTADDFIFSYTIQNASLVVQRNACVSILTLETVPDNTMLGVVLMWTFSKLILLCKFGPNPEDEIKSEVVTDPCAPPVGVLIWARKQNLLPVSTYKNEEEFRNKIHSCLLSIQDKINESSGFSQFWNLTYSGNTISSRTPKKEVEIHPTIQCLLTDQALLSSFDIVPEFKTGIGNLDFLLTGRLENGESSRVCVEFKNAHSKDLFHGITSQLPAYMRYSKSKYGVYGVLNYHGRWFQNPELESDNDIGVELNVAQQNTFDPIQQNIRTIVFYLAPPESASIK